MTESADPAAPAGLKAKAKRLAAPVVAKARQEIVRAAADDQLALRAEVTELRAELARQRAEHAAATAAVQEELAALQEQVAGLSRSGSGTRHRPTRS